MKFRNWRGRLENWGVVALWGVFYAGMLVLAGITDIVDIFTALVSSTLFVLVVVGIYNHYHR